MEFFKADQSVVDLVSEVCGKYHKHLGGHSIAVLFQDKHTKHAGKVVLASASKPPARLKPLIDADVEFVICIALDKWTNLTSEQREAVVDHELCHCAIDDEDGKPFIRGHDYEEFGDVIMRHGFWRLDYGEKLIQQAFTGMDIGVKVSTIKGPQLPGISGATVKLEK